MQTQPVKFAAAQILVFAKAPIENQVKTRLIPELGVSLATALYKAMLEQTIATVTHSNLCSIKLLCTPDSNHPYFQQLKSKYAIQLGIQQGADLGERMYHGALHALQSFKSVILLGTDCLQLTESLIGQTLAGLISNAHDAVITPAKDGGYVLMGLNKIDDCLFSNIAWGTEAVMDQTRRALTQLKWNWLETPALNDIDTFDDLKLAYKNKHQHPLNAGVRELLQSVFD